MKVPMASAREIMRENTRKNQMIASYLGWTDDELKLIHNSINNGFKYHVNEVSGIKYIVFLSNTPISENKRKQLTVPFEVYSGKHGCLTKGDFCYGMRPDGRLVIIVKREKQ